MIANGRDGNNSLNSCAPFRPLVNPWLIVSNRYLIDISRLGSVCLQVALIGFPGTVVKKAPKLDKK